MSRLARNTHTHSSFHLTGTEIGKYNTIFVYDDRNKRILYCISPISGVITVRPVPKSKLLGIVVEVLL